MGNRRGMKRCGWRIPGGYCRVLVEDKKHVYCKQHQPMYLEGFRARAQRAPGGLYSTKGWKALRKAHLAGNPLCMACGRPGQVVDHTQPHKGDPDLFFDSENLTTLCKPHHDQVTQLEIKLNQQDSKAIARVKVQWLIKTKREFSI